MKSYSFRTHFGHQLNSTQLNSTQLNSTQLNSTQLNSTQLNSTQLNSTLIEVYVTYGIPSSFCTHIKS